MFGRWNQKVDKRWWAMLTNLYLTRSVTDVECKLQKIGNCLSLKVLTPIVKFQWLHHSPLYFCRISVQRLLCSSCSYSITHFTLNTCKALQLQSEREAI
jgi:hypothetical protein